MKKNLLRKSRRMAAVLCIVSLLLVGCAVPGVTADGPSGNTTASGTGGSGTGSGSGNGSGGSGSSSGGSENGSGGSGSSSGGSGNGSGSSEVTSELVAAELDGSQFDYTTTSSSKYIQDPFTYYDTGLTYHSRSESADGILYNFRGNRSSGYTMLLDWVDLMLSGYHLEKTTDMTGGSLDNNRTFYFGIGLTYTGSGNVSGKGTVNFTDDTANITIYGIIDESSDIMDIVIWMTSDLDLVDMGLRYSGEDDVYGLVGDSALAGLYAYSDGTFETTDGRLSTTLGSATVLRDGVAYTGTATVEKSRNNNRVDYWVEDFYRDEAIVFREVEGRMMTGDVYLLEDLILNISWGDMGSKSELTTYTWNEMFGSCHDDRYFVPTYENERIRALTVRVMYMDSETLVLYICVVYPEEPYVLEMLAAYDLTEENTDYENAYGISVGGSVELSSDAFGEPGETFFWEVVEGEGLVSLSANKYQTCTVTALATGTAVIECTYSYLEDTTDVLTGIDRTEVKYIVTTYTVIISG